MNVKTFFIFSCVILMVSANWATCTPLHNRPNPGHGCRCIWHGKDYRGDHITGPNIHMRGYVMGGNPTSFECTCDGWVIHNSNCPHIHTNPNNRQIIYTDVTYKNSYDWLKYTIYGFLGYEYDHRYASSCSWYDIEYLHATGIPCTVNTDHEYYEPIVMLCLNGTWVPQENTTFVPPEPIYYESSGGYDSGYPYPDEYGSYGGWDEFY